MSRRQFTLDEKIGIIGRLENGEKNSVIAKGFGTSSSTISTIWKNRDMLKNMFQTTSLKIKRLCTAQHKDLEEAVLVRFKQQRCTNVPISGPILQVKTDQLAVKMKIENFKCSFSAFNRLQRMLVLTAYNELPVITRKTGWPLKLIITDFYCIYFTVHYMDKNS